MRTRLALAMLTSAAAGCAPALRAPERSDEHASIAQLCAAIDADAQRSDHERDAQARAALAVAARQKADACLRLDPQAAGCHFGLALALGLDAREHPVRAHGLLQDMLASLSRAEAADPGYEQGGPARVRALVLLRAPAWPLGPGDADAGLAAALRAVELSPAWPPNLLAAGEAWTRKGSADEARAAYARAREAAQALPASAERDAWLHEAEDGLRR